jgi:hypothetical protein
VFKEFTHLLQAEQLGEQDGFVAAGASTSQAKGAAEEPAVRAAALTEPAFAARRALVQGVGD